MKKITLFLFSAVLLVSIFLPKNSYAITVEVSAVVPGCGDGVISLGEQCDGSNLGGASCASQGFSGGALSCTASCTINTSACSAGIFTTGGGGAGGGGVFVPSTNVVFSGRAYPLSKVNLLKDGQLALSTIAGPDSYFSLTLSSLSQGNYTFSLYGEDKNGVRSTLFTFPVFVTSGATTKIGGIFIAPTIEVDKSQVKRGDTITIFGQSIPSAQVTVQVNSEQEFFIKKETDASGVYLVNFDTSVLEQGQHTTQAKAISESGDITPSSQVVGFLVGSQTVSIKTPKTSFRKGDLNNDDKVDLIDFSIAAFWYKKTLSKNFKLIEGERLNGDGVISLADFSVMAFYWTN